MACAERPSGSTRATRIFFVQTAGNEKGRVVSLFMAGGALLWIGGTRVLNGLDRSKKNASINRLRVSVIFYER